MRKYLTINGDLQLIPGEGCHFLSKSDMTLDEVEYAVLDWLEENPTHPIEPLVSTWLEGIDRYRNEQKQASVVEVAVKELEKSVRKCLTFKYQQNGLSIAKAREKAARNASAATAKLMED